MPIIDLINFFYPSNFEQLHLKWELKGCVVFTSHVVFLLFEKQPVTNFPCTSFTGPHNSVLSSQIEREALLKACTEKGIVSKGKGCYTLIQGVTAPLNCRVFINPRSYVLISSSSLCVTCSCPISISEILAIIWKRIFNTWQYIPHILFTLLQWGHTHWNYPLVPLKGVMTQG